MSIDNMDEFWSEMVLRSKFLSHEATKFAIAHSTPPYDSDCSKDLSNCLVNAAQNLVETYFTLPSSAGSTFLQVISQELTLLLSSTKEFTESVQKIVLDK
jgi:Grap2 and cyclin-D-interacting